VSITTVYLDLYQTVAYFHPPREFRLAKILKEFGFEVEDHTLSRGYLAADHYYTLAAMDVPIHLLTPADREKVYLRYQQVVLEEIGLTNALPMIEQIRERYQQVDHEFRLFPDVLPAIHQLRDSGYRIGVITNVTDDPTESIESMGLKGAFEAIIASCLVGYEKPDIRIFQAALAALHADPNQAVHVGDQFLADVEGAKAAGMKAVLLDRHDLQDGKHPYRIASLLDLVPLLRSGILE
jgi:putative hydrolase of the HAD superfamily